MSLQKPASPLYQRRSAGFVACYAEDEVPMRHLQWHGFIADAERQLLMPQEQQGALCIRLLLGTGKAIGRNRRVRSHSLVCSACGLKPTVGLCPQRSTGNRVDLIGANKDGRCSIADDRERREVAGTSASRLQLTGTLSPDDRLRATNPISEHLPTTRC